MSAFHEKILFGIGVLFSAAASTLGAVFTVGESRWLYVTITSSILTASFLALVFKRADESMRLVIGRCGLAILGGVLGSRFIVIHYGISAVNGDIVLLAGLAAAVTMGGFLIGYPLLQIINSKSGSIAERIFSRFEGK